MATVFFLSPRYLFEFHRRCLKKNELAGADVIGIFFFKCKENELHSRIFSLKKKIPRQNPISLSFFGSMSSKSRKNLMLFPDNFCLKRIRMEDWCRFLTDTTRVLKSTSFFSKLMASLGFVEDEEFWGKFVCWRRRDRISVELSEYKWGLNGSKCGTNRDPIKKRRFLPRSWTASQSESRIF